MREEKNNIVLVGMPGSGKTTVGEILADSLKFDFVDLDLLIEKNEGIKISEIFKKFGEKYFRKLEKDVLVSFQNASNVVLSTGGGIVKDAANFDVIKKIGISFYLEIMPDVIYKRIKDDDTRPLLQVKDPFDALNKLYNERYNSYKMADYIIDANKSVNDIKSEIIKIYENSKS